MISKTQINKRMKKKTNPELVEAIYLAKKNNYLDLAKKLSGPTKLQSKVNVGELNDLKENKIIVVGKVLGSGAIDKKISVAALGFSEEAKTKLNKKNCEIKSIKQMLKDNENIKEARII